MAAAAVQGKWGGATLRRQPGAVPLMSSAARWSRCVHHEFARRDDVPAVKHLLRSATPRFPAHYCLKTYYCKMSDAPETAAASPRHQAAQATGALWNEVSLGHRRMPIATNGGDAVSGWGCSARPGNFGNPGAAGRRRRRHHTLPAVAVPPPSAVQASSSASCKHSLDPYT